MLLEAKFIWRGHQDRSYRGQLGLNLIGGNILGIVFIYGMQLVRAMDDRLEMISHVLCSLRKASNDRLKMIWHVLYSLRKASNDRLDMILHVLYSLREA